MREPSPDETERLERALKECELDRQVKWEAIERLERALRQSDADRQARLVVIQQLDAGLKASEADREAQRAAIEQLDAALKASEVERDAQRTMIKELEDMCARAKELRAELAAARSQGRFWRGTRDPRKSSRAGDLRSQEAGTKGNLN